MDELSPITCECGGTYYSVLSPGRQLCDDCLTREFWEAKRQRTYTLAKRLYTVPKEYPQVRMWP